MRADMQRRQPSSIFADPDEKLPQDFDPEASDVDLDADRTSNDSQSELNEAQGREHYESVGASKLRKKDLAPLGVQYRGNRVSRGGIDADEELSDHDPFAEYDSEDDSEEELAARGTNGRVRFLENSRSEDEPPSDDLDSDDDNVDMEDIFDGQFDGSDADDADPTQKMLRQKKKEDRKEEDRAELKKILAQDHRNLAATVAEAAREDAAKGRAVRAQRQAFDALLNSRIRLQQGLVALNTVPTLEGRDVHHPKELTDETVQKTLSAAYRLWNSLDNLNQTLVEIKTGAKRKRVPIDATSPLSKTWDHMQDQDSVNKTARRRILNRWSSRTQAVPTRTGSSRLNTNAQQSTILDVIDEHLLNSEQLMKRTRIPRSAAPAQVARKIAESSEIYDDTDFYGFLMKDLLEQRTNDEAAEAAAAPTDLARREWQAAQTVRVKKDIDRKASKGRKLRYTVHEKLQNFMAPEDRCTWSEKAINELFGSLLGQRKVVDSENWDVDEDDRRNGEAALRLFRN